MKLKTGDNIIITSGKEKGKKGKITKVYFGICYGIEQEGHGKLTALERNLENNPRKYKSLKRAIENQKTANISANATNFSYFN